MNDREKLIDTIREFSKNTIVGHESGFYKMFKIQNVPEEALYTPNMMNLVLTATEQYMNSAYKSLILEDDQYFVEWFNKMSNCMNHSKICLLNLVCFIIVNIHINFHRIDLDATSYDKYIETVSKQFDENFEHIKEMLKTKISHQCKGDDIKTCDPNSKMFVLVPE